MKYAHTTTVAAVLFVAGATLAGCTDEPAGPGDWGLVGPIAFDNALPATNISGCDSYAASQRVRLYWRSGVGTSLPALTFEEVGVYGSSTGPDNGFWEIIRRPGNGEDSTTVENLRNGVAYYFRIATIDITGRINSLSRPIMTIPGEPEPPGTIIPAPRREVGDWVNDLKWSHDGARLAFLKQVNGAVNVHVLRVSDMSVRQLTNYTGTDHRLMSVDWSPDDQTLSYCYTPTSTAGLLDYRIWVVPADGGASRSVTSGQVDAGGAWLSSTEMIFTKGTIGPPNIPEFYSVDLAASNRETPIATDPTMRKYDPSLNRARTLMIFRGSSVTPGSPNGLYMVSPEGGTPDELMKSPHWVDTHASWSNNGGRIYFTSSRSGHYEVWSIDLASKELRQITRGQVRGVNRYYGRESPSGAGVAILEVGSRYDEATIHIVNIE